MHNFFTITLSVFEGQNKATINWPDYLHINEDWIYVENELSFTAFALSKMPMIIKSILSRYANQRLKELKGHDLENKANDLKTYCTGKEFSSKKSLSDVCKFVNIHSRRIKAIIPANESKQEGWKIVIEQLLEFCSSYTSGQAGPYLQNIAKSHFNPQIA